MTFQQKDIGPLYDFGLATRDGITLAVKNKDGAVINISQMAFCVAPNAQGSPVHEETELEHKAALVRLGSPNVIDREFDQWPQATQGDWSGGMNQRVFQDPSRYWDGMGVIWPINDYQPQMPFALPEIDQASTAKWTYMGATGGFVQSVGWGYAYVIGAGTPSTPNIVFQAAASYQGAGSYLSTGQIADVVIGNGAIWVLGSRNGTTFDLDEFYVSGGALTQGTHIQIAASGGLPANAQLAVATVGAREYVAVLWGANPGANTAILYDTTNRASITNIALSFPNSGRSWVTQALFSGDNLILLLTDGTSTYVVSYSIAGGVYSTLASIESGTVYMSLVAGSYFLVAYSNGWLDLYLLRGSALVHLGPLPTSLFDSGNFNQVGAVSRPQAWGPYALFAVSWLYSTSYPTVTNRYVVNLYAYDVTQDRLFLAWQNVYGNTGNIALGQPIAVLSEIAYTDHKAQWGVAINVTGPSNPAANAIAIQELHFGVIPTPWSTTRPAPSNLYLQGAFQLTSSLIDFSVVQPKLFRQIVAAFSPLANDPNATVELMAWLDTDPPSVGTATYDTGVITGTAKPALTQLVLPINALARKLVYRMVAGGGVKNGTTWVNASRLLWIAVQIATGWVWSLILDLAPSVAVNSKAQGTYVFQNQGQGIDHVAAYNFLKQLWRQKGGQAVAYFPDGDSYDVAIQDIGFDSPKPLAASFRADQPTSLQWTVSIKLREDL